MPDEFQKIADQITSVGNAEFCLNSIFDFPPPGGQLETDIRRALIQYIQGHISEAEAANAIQTIMQQAAVANIDRSNINPIFIDHPEINPGNY